MIPWSVVRAKLVQSKVPVPKGVWSLGNLPMRQESSEGQGEVGQDSINLGVQSLSNFL